MEDNSMFRYLLKYVGKYRVLSELTLDTHDFIRDSEGNVHSDYDELYIECSRGSKIKHTYKNNILSYWTLKASTFKSVRKKLEDSNIEYSVEDDCDDYIIYFNASDMNKVARIVGAKTTGKKIHPFDSRNIPDKIDTCATNSSSTIVSYSIPSTDISKYYDKLSVIRDRSAKIQFTKQSLKDFDSIIINKKGKDFNPKSERDKLNMKPKEYIHYIGMWGDYMDYIDKELSKIWK